MFTAESDRERILKWSTFGKVMCKSSVLFFEDCFATGMISSGNVYVNY